MAVSHEDSIALSNILLNSDLLDCTVTLLLSMSCGDLKGHCTNFGLNPNGRNEDLISRIMEFGHCASPQPRPRKSLRILNAVPVVKEEKDIGTCQRKKRKKHQYHAVPTHPDADARPSGSAAPARDWKLDFTATHNARVKTTSRVKTEPMAEKTPRVEKNARVEKKPGVEKKQRAGKKPQSTMKKPRDCLRNPRAPRTKQYTGDWIWSTHSNKWVRAARSRASASAFKGSKCEAWCNAVGSVRAELCSVGVVLVKGDFLKKVRERYHYVYRY